MKTNSKYVFIRHNGEFQKVKVADIAYVAADGDYVTIKIHGRQECIRIHGTLSSMHKKLPDIFCRVHRSTLVNVDHVISFAKEYVYVNDSSIGGKHFSVGEFYKKELFTKIPWL